jgi:cell division protease FtsH
VRRIVTECYQRARGLLKSNLELLHKVAQKLLEKEVLDGSEIDALMRDLSGNGSGNLLSPAAVTA